MLVGIVGKPSTGKTSLWNALTHGHAAVAAYPFTTIDPNKGVAFVRIKCACAELGVKCEPRVGKCANGEREVPVNVIDVAGLVEGAHEGKGRGNQFLSDLNQADALACVADAAGATDAGGNLAALGSHDPAQDVSMIEDELDYWFLDVLKRNAAKAKGKKLVDFVQLLSGIRVNEEILKQAIGESDAGEDFSRWNDVQLLSMARILRRTTKPFVVAANKIDLPPAREGIKKLKAAFPNYAVVPTAADAELALQRAREKGWIEYDGKNLKIVASGLDEKIKRALETIEKNVLREYGSTGVQELLRAIVFDVLNLIVVFPVEDEKHFSDHFGKVLPDAILLKNGSTPLQLAEAIHTDLAKHFLHAVDARTGMRVSREHELKNGDVIKIVSTK
jgi:ribosome-binding ATPase YchF (GTP1/OBG family)